MRRELDPHTKDRREPLEILAMLAGRTNFPRIRGEALRAQQPITPLDVAHALAQASDTLGSSMGVAIACEREQEWGRVHELSYVPLLGELQQQRAFPDIVQSAKRFRVRIVLYDAFRDLIWPARREPIRVAAKEAGIDKNAYGFLHHHVTSFLHARANTAARDACEYLFSMIERARRPDPQVRQKEVEQPCSASTAADAFDEVVLSLLADIVRAPRPGLLRLPQNRAPSLSEPIDSILDKA